MAKKATVAVEPPGTQSAKQVGRSEPRLPALRPIRDRQTVEAIMDAVDGLDVTTTPAWNDLNALSSHTVVDSVEVLPEGIFATVDNGFAAVATVYVDLTYGNGDDGMHSSDAVHAHVNGHFEPNGKAVVDSFDVDTSSFYA